MSEEVHPRRELTQDADALGRVALIADYFEFLAKEDHDDAKAEDVSIDAEVLRRWEALLKTIRVEMHPNRPMNDGS